MAKKTRELDFDSNGKPVVIETSKKKGSLYFEGTTKRSFGLMDSIKTFRQGR